MIDTVSSKYDSAFRTKSRNLSSIQPADSVEFVTVRVTSGVVPKHASRSITVFTGQQRNRTTPVYNIDIVDVDISDHITCRPSTITNRSMIVTGYHKIMSSQRIEELVQVSLVIFRISVSSTAIFSRHADAG